MIPKKDPISSYKQQTSIIEKILTPSTVLPPSLRYIVIDTISHHPRFQLMQYTNVSNVSSLLNTFYDTQLMPLILFCKRKGTILILIHEVTFSPKDQCNRPFFYKLYDRIEKVDIDLHQVFASDQKIMDITHNTSCLQLYYIIEHKEIVLIPLNDR